MIEIKILDKNGIELKDGDTVRYVSMTPIYQDEVFCRFQNGVKIEYCEYKIDAQSEINELGIFFIPAPHFDKVSLLELFQCGYDCQEEYDGVIVEVCSALNFDYINDDEFYKKINGLELIK